MDGNLIENLLEDAPQAHLENIRHLERSEKTLMDCQTLATQIQELQPEAAPQDVARLCLLLSTAVESLEQLSEAEALHQAWQEAGLKLQAATDQHAAMTQELEELASSDPREFSQDQIWILIRAIKVQSQILQMYVGNAALDV